MIGSVDAYKQMRYIAFLVCYLEAIVLGQNVELVI